MPALIKAEEVELFTFLPLKLGGEDPEGRPFFGESDPFIVADFSDMY